MKTLNFTVLFHEGPMGRAYLEMLRYSGCKPTKIIHMVPRSGGVSKLLPKGIRRTMAAARQEQLANHWPRVLAKQFPGVVREMTQRLESVFSLGDGFVERLRSGQDLSAYCDKVERRELANFKDPAFLEGLRAQPESLLLFTGGGILPAATFNVPHIRFLHFHPGFLPHVRGADGLLWSTLVRGRPGVSGFIMQPGLDVGDLVTAFESEPLRFAVPKNENPEDVNLYRMIFSYYDPVLRAVALRRLLERLGSPATLAGEPQDMKAGITYHFMEPRMRAFALDRLFDRTGAALFAG